MGFLEGLLGGKPNEIIYIGEQEAASAIKELSKYWPSTALGRFMESKFVEHIEKRQDYVIRLNDASECAIFQGRSKEKVMEVMRGYMPKSNEQTPNLFQVMLITPNLNTVQNADERTFIPASRVHWLQRIRREKLEGEALVFIVNLRALYARFARVMKKNGLEISSLEDAISENGVVRIKNHPVNKGLDLFSYFALNVVPKGQPLDYSFDTGLSWIVPGKLVRIEREGITYKTAKEALDGKAKEFRELAESDVKAVYFFSPTLMEEYEKRKTHPLAERIDLQRPFEIDDRITGEIKIWCEKGPSHFGFLFPTFGVLQNSRLVAFARPATLRYCKKCGSVFLKQAGDIFEVLKLEKNYADRLKPSEKEIHSKDLKTLTNELDINLLTYWRDNKYIGGYDALKTCDCGGKLIDVALNCPVCQTPLVADQDTAALLKY